MYVPHAQADFVERLERHRGIVVKVAAGYCRQPADREDLMQEMLVQLWRSYPRYNGSASFSTWMYRIAVNVAISWHRERVRRGSRVISADQSVLDIVQATQSEPEDDRITAVYDFIEGLDELNRAMMILYLNDNSYAEIAAVLGISLTNVATKIARIKQKLRASAVANANTQ